MRVNVDFDLCQSNGICTSLCPEVFEIRPDGFLYVVDTHPGDALRGRLDEAVQHCPTGAIAIEG
ncbi:MAG: ferredoxin [Acidimicrobiales bacterium]